MSIGINNAPPAAQQAATPAALNNFAIWLANILLIGGAVVISVLPHTASSPLLFAGFLIGHVCLSMHTFRLRDRGLLILNVSMGMLDLYAIGIRI